MFKTFEHHDLIWPDPNSETTNLIISSKLYFLENLPTNFMESFQSGSISPGVEGKPTFSSEINRKAKRTIILKEILSDSLNHLNLFNENLKTNHLIPEKLSLDIIETQKKFLEIAHLEDDVIVTIPYKTPDDMIEVNRIGINPRQLKIPDGYEINDNDLHFLEHEILKLADAELNKFVSSIF